ncbi:MAG: DNA polymerase III subunit delta' [Xanthomonadales bacterium]|nr:DNA polymerase III subunit delta' [Xanthomonadales bacterium]
MIHPWLQTNWENLLACADADRVPHALLLHGPRGVGKRSLADAFAAALLCEDREAGASACGSCQACTLVAAGTHPDLHRVGLEEDRSQVRVDQIRELSRRAALTSSRGTYQLFIVDPADRMNRSAANAFLKTLEEPRAGSVLMLVADTLGNLPVTILSRCRRLTIALPSRDEARAFLAGKVSEADMDLLLEAAGGSPGLAAEYVDAGLEGAYRQIRQDLGAAQQGREGPVEIAERWVAENPAQCLDWMASLLTETSWALARGQEPPVALTGRWDLVSLTKLLAETYEARRLLETSLRPELLIEALLIRWVGDPKMTGGSPW